MSTYREALDAWLGELSVNAGTVFDVGGSQLKLKDRVANWNVDEYLIFDLKQPHIDSPAPDVVCDLNSGHNLDAVGYMGLADEVYCLEVFDYVYRPELALKTLRGLIKGNGVLWVSFPTVYPVHNPAEEDALRYTLPGIEKLAKLVKLNIEEVIPRRPKTNALGMLYVAEGLRAAKGYDNDVLGYLVRFSR